MFDLSRIFETVGGAFGQTAESANSIDVGSVLQTLAEQGVDLEQLQNLDVSELSTLLGEHGIDPSQFDAANLLENIGGEQAGGVVGELLSKFINR